LNLHNKNQQDALFFSQYISIINLYMFQAGLLLIIRRYFSVYTETGICHAFMLAGFLQDWGGTLLAASLFKCMTHTLPIAVYPEKVPPNDEQ